MAMVTASSHFSLNLSSPLLLRASPFPANAPPPFSKCFPAPMQPATTTSESSRSRRTLLSPFVIKKNKFSLDIVEGDVSDRQEVGNANANETLLYSFNPLPLLLLATLPGAGTLASLFEPFVELVKLFGLPGWLVHWGHPGNMAVVLFAMGGYGTCLGYRIRFSDDVEKANAKDLHPKLLSGMFFFFALGETGGGKPELRTVHGVFGTGIMTLFVVHAALGLRLGLSY